MMPRACHPFPCPSSSSPSSSSSSFVSSTAFTTKFGAPKSASIVDKKRHEYKQHHRLRPSPNCCCWLALDVHADWVHYVPIFEEDILRAKAVEPNALAKTIFTSTKSLRTFRQEHHAGGWQLSDLSAMFAYICAIVDCHCAGSEPNCNPPTRVPVKAIIVVPTNCSLPYQMAMESAAEAAGIGQVHLVRRATALAISYRMLYLDDDEAQLLCKSINGTEAGVGTREEEEEAKEQTAELIVQLDNGDDDSDLMRMRRDQFVAILYVCEYCLELSIYDFHPLHAPKLISSKMLSVTDPTTQIDLINKFLRRHLSPFHYKLLKLLTSGVPKLIATIVPTIRKHIASCQLLTKCSMVPSDLVAVFGAALNAVHLKLTDDGTDQSPLFLNRSMVPHFDYTATGDREGDEEVDKLQEQNEAIDNNFFSIFGLLKQTPSEEEGEGGEGTTTPTTEASDVTLSDHQQHRNGMSATEAPAEDGEAFFDALLSSPRGKQQMQRTCAKKQLTDDERRLLADVVTAFGSEPFHVGATTEAADSDVDGNDSLASRHRHAADSLSYACSVSSKHYADSSRQSSAAAGASRRFSEPLLRPRDACGERRGGDCMGTTSHFAKQNNCNTFRSTATHSLKAETLAQNVINLEAVNRMKWEETDDEDEGQEGREDEEADEIATLGDDRSIITPLSSSECPSGISSPRLLQEDEQQQRRRQSVSAEADDGTDTLDEESSVGASAPAALLNSWGEPVDGSIQWTHVTYEGLGQHYLKRRGRTSRNKNYNKQTPMMMKTTTMAPAATMAPRPVVVEDIERPSSRASTLQAMSDDDNADDSNDDRRRRTVPTNCSTATTNNNTGSDSNHRRTDYGSGGGGDQQQQQPTVERVGFAKAKGGAQRPQAGKFSATIEQQFLRSLPMFAEGELSSVQLVGLPLVWISNKFFQQEFKEWLRIRCGLRSKAVINCFITYSVSTGNAFRICRFGRFSNAPYNGTHNQLFVYALFPTPEVAWHVCWACNQFEDNLGIFWPAKYGQMRFTPTVTMAARQTFLGDETNP